MIWLAISASNTSRSLAIKTFKSMKTTVLSLSFLLFSIYTSSFCSIDAAPYPVLDAGGKMLRANAYYYIVPAERGNGGGLTLSGIGSYTCPLAIVQERFDSRNGLPIRFYPEQYMKGSIIPASTDLNIEFSYPERCGESTVWQLNDYDQSTGKYFVGVGGQIGDSSPRALTSWFKIERYGYGYKLVYCPTVCMDCEVVCKDVGIVYQDGQRRLALTDDRPLKVIFKLAK